MRSFIIKSLLFILPFFVLLIIGECVARISPNEYKYKEEWMREHGNEVHTLVFGSSHGFYGISPKNLGNDAFSLANVSQTIVYDDYLLRRYQHRNLKNIIIPISYFTMITGDLENGAEWYRAIFYKLYMGYPKHSNFSIYNFEIASFQSYKAKIASFFEKSQPKYDEKGWGTSYTLDKKDKDNWDKSISVEAARRHTKDDFSRLSQNYNYLKSMARYCKNNGIRMILVTTPVWKSYYIHLEKKQLKVMSSSIKKLVDEENVEYHNYFCDKRFVEDDFYDGDHLSDVGAKKFSKILRRELNL